MGTKKNQKQRYVVLGDLIVDIYWKNGNPIYIDGGGSRFNVISHLATRGEETYAMVGCGNDWLGSLAIQTLKNLGVTIICSKRQELQTRTYNLLIEGNRHISTKTCPICGKKMWYEKPIVDFHTCKEQIQETDILILDGLKEENISVLTYANNKKVLDIGRTKRLLSLTNQEILSFLQNKNIQLLQLNEVVEIYLLERFGVNEKELFELLAPNVLIVTRGKKGATFITQDFIISKKLKQCAKEIDDTGAGDAFFSVVIQEYFKKENTIDLDWVDQTFEKATKITQKVVSYIGARGCLYQGFIPPYTQEKYNYQK